jgi:hypothetical protein
MCVGARIRSALKLLHVVHTNVIYLFINLNEFFYINL